MDPGTRRAASRALLHNHDFLRLLTTRLVGSLGDGFLQAALASFVLFSPERQPTPLAVAASFGILLLPYSLVGPFAGVFLDRWRRRQVLARGNWLRAATVLVTIAVVSTGQLGLPLGIVVLVTLGIGRFVLSGLSAALPHVVSQDQLVTANAIAPTAGTIVYGAGALAGITLHRILGGGDADIGWLLLVAALVYAAAGIIPLRFGEEQLGPTGDRPGETVADVAHGLVDGFRVLAVDRPSWHSLAVIFGHRVLFGVLTVLLLLVLRNTLHAPSDPDAALADFAVVAAAVTVGALLAAVLTPAMTRRMGTVRWTTLTLLACAVTAPVALSPVHLAGMAVGGAVIGMGQQAAKIGADTTLQRRISDNHLGRVFSLYDVGVNVCLVLGALLAAVTAPLSGVWLPGYLALGLVYLAIALWYRRTRDPSDLGGPAARPAE